MTTDYAPQQLPAAPSLADVDGLKLSPELQARLDEVIRRGNGAAFWRSRKQAEAHALLALSQLASRLAVVDLDPQVKTCCARLPRRRGVPPRA